MAQLDPESDSDFIYWMGVYETHCLAEGQSLRTIQTKLCNISMFAKRCLANNISHINESLKRMLKSIKPI